MLEHRKYSIRSFKFVYSFEIIKCGDSKLCTALKFESFTEILCFELPQARKSKDFYLTALHKFLLITKVWTQYLTPMLERGHYYSSLIFSGFYCQRRRKKLIFFWPNFSVYKFSQYWNVELKREEGTSFVSIKLKIFSNCNSFGFTPLICILDSFYITK